MICRTAVMALFAPMDDGWRPTTIGYLDHDTLPIRCHWEDEDDADRCEDILGYMETSWSYQIDELGFVAPMLTDDDGIMDVYITDDGTEGGAYVTGPGVDEDSSDGRSGHHTYMALDPSIPKAEMESYVAHEFQHTSQYATDFNEWSLPIWEGVAEAAALWTMGEGYAPPKYYGTDFQKTPWVGLLSDAYMLYDEHEIWSYYEYGSMVAFLYFDDAYGESTGEGLVSLWAELAQEGSINEPDVLDAIEVLAGDWRGFLLDLSLERTWLGGGDDTPTWGELYSHEDFGVAIDATAEASDFPAELEPLIAPLATGTVYFQVTGLEPGQTVSIEVQDGGDVEWGLVLTDGDSHSTVDGSSTTFSTDTGDTLTVGVVSFGKADFDADAPITKTAEDFTLAIDTADDTGDDGGDDGAGGSGDGGDDGDDDDGKGCGCASSQPAAGLGLLLLPLAGVLRRRRS